LEDSLQLAAGSSNFSKGLSSLKETQKLKIKKQISPKNGERWRYPEICNVEKFMHRRLFSINPLNFRSNSRNGFNLY